MFRRCHRQTEPLPIDAESRRLPRLTDAQDEGMADEGTSFSDVQVRALGFVFGDTRDRVRALVGTQLRQAAARRLLGEALAIAAPRSADGAPEWGDGTALAHGCPPHEAGFARLHCQIEPGEAAAARRSAIADRAYPQIAVAERAGALHPADGRRLRAIATSPEQVDAWLGLAVEEDPGALRRRLRRARKGEHPNAVRDVPAGPVDAPVSAEPDAAHDLDLTLRLAHCDAETFDRAIRVAGGQANRILSLPDATRAWITRGAAELAAGRAPASLADTVPPKEWHIDPIRQVAWVQAGRGRWQVAMDRVPRPGALGARPVRVVALGPSGERLDPSIPALLDTYPELADDDPAAPIGSDTWRATGLVTWGVTPPLPIPDSTAEDAQIAERSGDATPKPAGGRMSPGIASLCSPSAPSAVTPSEAAAIAAAAARAMHAAASDELEIVAAWDRLAVRSDDMLTSAVAWHVQSLLGITPHAWLDRARVGRRLYHLPLLAEAAHTGDLPYAKVRLIARYATSETEAAWIALARLVDPETLETFATATPKGAAPVPVSFGMTPLRPLGGMVTFQVRLRLQGSTATTEAPSTAPCLPPADFAPPEAAAWREIRQALDRLAGSPLTPQQALLALAGWYLRLVERRRCDTVIYQRSPETRGTATPRDLMPLELRVTGREPGARLRLAFGLLPELPEEPRRHDRPRPDFPQPNGRAIPRALRAAVRWRDGERCIVPGCGNDRVVQHDHGTPVAQGGTANVEKDHRLCGPCNRAKHLGLLRLIHGPYATVQVVDRQGRPFGSVRLGTEWDAAVRAWVEAEAAREWDSGSGYDAFVGAMMDVHDLFARAPSLDEEIADAVAEHDRELALARPRSLESGADPPPVPWPAPAESAA